MFVNFPGGKTYNTHTVGVSNLHTGAWARYVGWDAMCFMRLRGSLFFGTQDGTIQQIESSGYDDAHWDEVERRTSARSYVCKLVGGWEMFQVPPNQVTWLQARATFFSLTASRSSRRSPPPPTTSFRIPPPPSAGPDPGCLTCGTRGCGIRRVWDAPSAGIPPVRNTIWVSDRRDRASAMRRSAKSVSASKPSLTSS